MSDDDFTGTGHMPTERETLLIAARLRQLRHEGRLAPPSFPAGIDYVEEPMDYTPVARGRLAHPGFPDEVEPDDDGDGPMGF